MLSKSVGRRDNGMVMTTLASWSVLCIGCFSLTLSLTLEPSELDKPPVDPWADLFPRVSETDVYFATQYSEFTAEQMEAQLEQLSASTEEVKKLILEGLVASDQGLRQHFPHGAVVQPPQRPAVTGTWLVQSHFVQGEGVTFLSAVLPPDETLQLALLQREMRWLRDRLEYSLNSSDRNERR